MRGKQGRGLFLFGLILIISMMSVVPTSAATKKRVVRVACGMNDALYLNKAGEPQGTCLPYLRQLEWSNQWTFKYVEGSYSEGLENLRSGKVDLMFPVGESDNDDGKLAYSKFIGGYQQIGLFAKEDADIYYDDYKGFDQKKVGLSIGGNSEILDDYAKKHHFSYTKVPLNSISDKVKALKNGSVDMLAFSTLNTVPGAKLVAVLDQTPFYFCTRKSDTKLHEELNQGMSQAMVDAPDIVSTMFHDVLKGSNGISLTREENKKVKKTKQVVFGVYSDCLPLAGVNSEGKCVGIYVDVLKEIAKQSGLKIIIKPVKDSNKLYSYMDDGTVDFVIGAQELRFSSPNANNYLASNGIGEFTMVAVTKSNFKFDQVKSPKIALTKNRNFIEDYIYENYPKATIEYCKTRRDCLNQVESGKADATFLNTWEYNYETKNSRFGDLIEWENMRIDSVFSLGGMKTSDLELLSILEKTNSKITTERLSDIIASNLNMSYDSYTWQDRFYEARDEIFAVGIVLLVTFVCVAVYMRVKGKYIKELEVANKSKSDFLSRMSHELRTPLNAIEGYASMTADSVKEGSFEEDDVVDQMSYIQKASDYLLGIITDILDVQQMETGEITLNIESVNLRDFVKELRRIIRPLAREKKIRFTSSIDEEIKADYKVDSLRVKQVLFKLLYNAVKFTPEGGEVSLTTKVVQEESEATVEFIVEDTGIGMSKEFMEHKLFHMFAQENEDITSPYSGCGNGLAICKKLMNVMDGEIACESKRGKGTKFTVTLTVPYEKAKKVESRSKRFEKYQLTGIRVLMCEDNKMNQDMEKKVLERMQCEVEIADDGQIGLDKFKASKEGYYDIVLMDIRMPNMDGWECTRAIRALEREDAKKVPILAVSANAFEEDIRTSLASGMNEHLSKPVDARKLYEKIREYCPKETT